MSTRKENVATRHGEPTNPTWPPRTSKAYYVIQFAYVADKAGIAQALTGIESRYKFCMLKNPPKSMRMAWFLHGLGVNDSSRLHVLSCLPLIPRHI